MDRLRNFGIVAHIDAGKTTLGERILFDAGAQAHLGEVDDGTATLDWMRHEQTRGISITAAATRLSWGERLMQLVDTPGHVDFTAEVERCLRVLDGVVVVLDGVRGVESQTETVWQQARRWNVPAVAFVNKLDRAGADFAACCDALRERLGCVPVPVVVPLYLDGSWAGLGDAIAGEVQWFAGEVPPAELPRLRAELDRAREALVEACAEFDDGVLDDYLAGRRPAAARLASVLGAACRSLRAVPVLGGSALHNRGVEWLLDAIVAYLPSPVQRVAAAATAGEPTADPKAPFCGLVFKVQHLGDAVLHYVRVFAGTLRPGVRVRCNRTGADVELGELWAMHAMRHEVLAAAEPGEIVVLAGAFDFATGDTLHDPDHPAALPPPHFPRPVLTATFEPEAEADLAALAAGLRDLARDDPTLQVTTDPDTGLPAVSGMGELHLEVVAEQLREHSRVRFASVRPHVALAETVTALAEGQAEVRAIVDGVERRATAQLTLEPVQGDGTAVAVDAAPSSRLRTAVRKELEARLVAGIRSSHPARGLRLTVHRVETSGGDAEAQALALQACRIALEKACERAGPRMLEPMVTLTVTCPADAVTPVLADLNARGVEVRQVSSGELGGNILGRGRLAALLGYATRLRSITKGRGQAQLAPDGFAPVAEGPVPGG